MLSCVGERRWCSAASWYSDAGVPPLREMIAWRVTWGHTREEGLLDPMVGFISPDGSGPKFNLKRRKACQYRISCSFRRYYCERFHDNWVRETSTEAFPMKAVVSWYFC